MDGEEQRFIEIVPQRRRHKERPRWRKFRPPNAAHDARHPTRMVAHNQQQATPPKERKRRQNNQNSFCKQSNAEGDAQS